MPNLSYAILELNSTGLSNYKGKTANSLISTIPLKFEDIAARNAFEYLQMIYIARN